MITVIGKCVEKANKHGAVHYSKAYMSPTGLSCRQTRMVQRESDYENEREYRDSTDNGRTWGSWIPEAQENISIMYGNDEMTYLHSAEFFNPIHSHYVSTVFSRFFPDGHKKAYELYWGKGEHSFFDHQSIAIRRPGESDPYTVDLIRYEDGVDFNPQNPRDPDFLEKNQGFNNPPYIMRNGDIIVPVGVPVYVGCRIAKVNVKDVFPSRPEIHRCAMVARGRYNKESEKYDFTFSNPVILDDLRSSRGIDEPIVAELKNGRIIMIMRGSNTQYSAWNTRIKPGTPSFKWFSYSDDGGRTFSEPEPWSFDDGELVSSGANISRFIRSEKNGNLYWIGNITEQSVTIPGLPRYPLYILRVDEETGLAKKDTLTMIDTKRDGDSDAIQLSNFQIFEDRETGMIEVTLAKINQFYPDKPSYYCESWQYDINVDE